MAQYDLVDSELPEKLNWLPSRTVKIFGHQLWTRFSRSFKISIHSYVDKPYKILEVVRLFATYIL